MAAFSLIGPLRAEGQRGQASSERDPEAGACGEPGEAVPLHQVWRQDARPYIPAENHKADEGVSQASAKREYGVAHSVAKVKR